MGGNSWHIRAAVTVAVHVLGLMTSQQVRLADQLYFCNTTANITSECCIHCDYNATCNNTCPEEQLILNLTNSFPTCVFSNDSNSNVTSSEEESRDFVVVCVPACPVKYYQDGGRCEMCDDVCNACTGPGTTENNCTCSLRYNGDCVTKCEVGFYNNGGNCAKCDDACTSCNGSGRRVDTCDCKFEFNGTCYESCHPNITKCSDENVGEDDINLPVIIGASVGGVVFVVIIIVVVVIVVKCCRRRKGGGKSRMSTIIESRGADKEEEEQMGIQLPMKAKKVKTGKAGKYENVQVLGGAVSTQAQHTQDKMTRYAKDPTLPRGQALEDQPVSNRHSSLYVNEDAIKLCRNLAKGEDRGTKLNRGVFSKFKKSVMSRKSKKKEVFTVELSSTDADAYCDMSRDPNSDAEQEDYVQVNAPVDAEPQDDYENFGETSRANISDDEPQDDYENFGKTSKIKTTDDGPQEDYENFGNTSKIDTTDDGPQEDYENFGNTSKVDLMDDAPQEDYENFGFTSAETADQEESPYINVQNFRKET